MKQKKYTGKGVGVAVLDTGIYPHIDFDCRIAGFFDFVQGKKFPYDDNSHGTHVAGILAGSGIGSGRKVRGVACGCHLVALKVLDRLGNGKKQDVLSAFQWILENYKEYDIRIVNISVGTTYNNINDHNTLIQGAEILWDAGLTVIAAAGNRGPLPGTITAPGSSKKVITVGCSDMLLGRQAVSGRGPTMECVCKPDLVAPGNRIVSCVPPYAERLNCYMNPYGIKSGTSMSTPYISGAAALMLEKRPELSNVEIKAMLRESTVDLGLPHNLQGCGKFSMEKFMRN